MLRATQVAGHSLRGQTWHPQLLSNHWTRQFPRRQARTLFYLPTILQPAFWRSLLPSFLRRDSSGPSGPSVKKPRNPATYFIWMSLLIGSQAIQLITLQRGFERFTYETDQKLALLRDVVGRVKEGEDVDVEKELGTGDPVKEQEWENVMKELESEDGIFTKRKRERRKKDAGQTGTSQDADQAGM